MLRSIGLNSQIKYEVKIHGQPDDSWLGWFGDAIVQTDVLADNSQVTTFSDVVMDQAGLVGLIRRLHGRGIVLISIAVCESDDLAVSQHVPDPEDEWNTWGPKVP